MLNFRNANAGDLFVKSDGLGELCVNQRFSGYKRILAMHKNYTRSALVPNIRDERVPQKG